MIAKYGGEEALKLKRQEWQAKARKDTPRGFAVIKEKNPDRLKEIVIMGGKASKRGKSIR